MSRNTYRIHFHTVLYVIHQVNMSETDDLGPLESLLFFGLYNFKQIFTQKGHLKSLSWTLRNLVCSFYTFSYLPINYLTENNWEIVLNDWKLSAIFHKNTF